MAAAGRSRAGALRVVSPGEDHRSSPEPEAARRYLRHLVVRLRQRHVSSAEHAEAIEACIALIGPLPAYRPHNEEWAVAVHRATAEASAWFETLRRAFALIYERERTTTARSETVGPAPLGPGDHENGVER